jgi:hypothetical protein
VVTRAAAAVLPGTNALSWEVNELCIDARLLPS